MLGAGSVPLLGVLCACRTRWSSAPAVRCHVFHRVQRSASSDNQPLWFSGTRQCWPWAAPVLGRFLAWLSRRVVMDSAQPLRRSVAIWCSSSAHRARSTCSSLCTAWRSTIFSDPRRFALFFVHLVAYACPYMCLHVFHLGVYSRFPLCLFDHISQPFSGGMVYLFFIFSRGCYSKLLFADYRGGMVLVSKVSPHVEWKPKTK